VSIRNNSGHWQVVTRWKAGSFDRQLLEVARWICTASCGVRFGKILAIWFYGIDSRYRWSVGSSSWYGRYSRAPRTHSYAWHPARVSIDLSFSQDAFQASDIIAIPKESSKFIVTES
jgi:hypothetical protein